MGALVRNAFNFAADRLGFEFQRSTTLRRFFATHPIDLVIDAGANLGQFGQSIRNKGYSGRILSFEPVAYVYAQLCRAIAQDPLWSAVQLALGAETGEATINVSPNHTLSSFLRESETFQAFGFDTNSSPETVGVARLDDLLVEQLGSAIFLKADVQGFEKQVLEGARETLCRTHAVYLELPIEHLYEGGWSFPEAIRYLDDLGFTPAQFRTVTSLPDDRSSAVEFDVLFRRKFSH